MWFWHAIHLHIDWLGGISNGHSCVPRCLCVEPRDSTGEVSSWGCWVPSFIAKPSCTVLQHTLSPGWMAPGIPKVSTDWNTVYLLILVLKGQRTKRNSSICVTHQHRMLLNGSLVSSSIIFESFFLPQNIPSTFNPASQLHSVSSTILSHPTIQTQM